MLVLTRRPDQSLWIGDDVEVTVVRVEGERVVLGVRAPREVTIVRGELRLELEAETRAAAGGMARVRDILSGAP